MKVGERSEVWIGHHHLVQQSYAIDVYINSVDSLMLTHWGLETCFMIHCVNQAVCKKG